MTYQIVMPIYKDLPHIAEHLEALNDWEHLLIVDNSVDSFCKKFEGRGAKIEYRPANIGVSRAWNLGIAEDKDYTFFVSSSVKFNKGFKEVADHLQQLINENDLNLVAYLADDNPNKGEFKSNNIEWGLFTQLGWHCNGVSKLTVEKIGYFDENFYPAYMEDTDYCVRMGLAQIPGRHQDVPAYCQKTGQAIDSGATTNPARSTDYWNKKWGGTLDIPEFNKPFGDKPLDYWPERSIAEIIEEWDNREGA